MVNLFSVKYRRAQRLMGNLSKRRAVKRSVWQQYGRFHAAKIDPFQLLWIDPRSIDYALPISENDFSPDGFAVLGGDWDLRAVPLTRLDPRFSSLVARFTRQVPWESTELFGDILMLIEKKGSHWHGCKNVNDVLSRCARLDQLYAAMKEGGYKPQRQLYGQGWRGFLACHTAVAIPESNEILIGIGRDGRVIFVDGIHRLAMACSLPVPTVPTCVLYRHELWQDVRDQYATTGTVPSPSLLTHPDLASTSVTK
jgi:hypothetical protein